jgi:hypothetical protein
MPSSGILRSVALVRTDVSDERLHHQIFLCSMLRLLVTGNVPKPAIIVTMMVEAICSSESSVLTIATMRNIPEDGVSHSHRRGNLKSHLVFLTPPHFWQIPALQFASLIRLVVVLVYTSRYDHG